MVPGAIRNARRQGRRAPGPQRLPGPNLARRRLFTVTALVDQASKSRSSVCQRADRDPQPQSRDSQP